MQDVNFTILEEINRQAVELMNFGYTPNLVELTQTAYEQLLKSTKALLTLMGQYTKDEKYAYTHIQTQAGSIPLFVSVMGTPVVVHAYGRTSPIWTAGMRTDKDVLKEVQEFLDKYE